MNQLNTIAIDLAKNVFQVAVVSPHNKILENKQVTRKQLPLVLARQEPSIVAMEACFSSHHWARTFQSMGHQVRLIPAQHVKPFVRGNKNDSNDAIAISEASKRPNLRFVPVKSVEQQDIQALHRIRDRFVSQRTALINQARGLFSEYGLVAPQGLTAFQQFLASIQDPENQTISSLMKQQAGVVLDEYYSLTQRIKEATQQLTVIAQQYDLCKILLSLPGIGVMNATALFSAIGDGSQFASPREFAVWLGLTPRHKASAEKFSSSGITKRGNRYLRKLLVQGAHAIIPRCKNKTDTLSVWIHQLVKRRGKQKAAVALAHRLARLAWVLLQRKEPYQPQ